MKQSIHLASWLAASVLALGAPVQADAVADFYKGRKITAISGGGAAGGFSFAARILGRHIVGNIPGNPSWVVTAMPGAGGARSVKYIVNAAAQDGTVIGVILPPAILSPLLRKKVGYDSAKLQWIGSITPMPSVLSVWHTTKINKLADAKTIETTMATSSKLSTGYFFPAFLNEILGTKFKIIAGYRGGDRQNNAMEKGEVDGRSSFFNSYKTTKPHWLRDKTIRHMVYMGPKLPEIGNVPHLMTLARNDEERQIVRFMETGSSVGHGFFVSPGVPKARVAALRAAFDKTVSSPAFLAEAKKRNQVVSPVRGVDLDKSVAAAMATSPALIAKFRQMTKLDSVKLRKKKKTKK
jgi:tripartite-type tricarboxylate transporter receptor subunit TctC